MNKRPKNAKRKQKLTKEEAKNFHNALNKKLKESKNGR